MKLAHSEEDILATLMLNRRPYLAELARRAGADRRTSLSLACDLLIELFSTMKATLLKEPRATLNENQLRMTLEKEHTLAASHNTFTGHLLHVQYKDGEHVAMKIASQERAQRIRECAQVTIHLLDSYSLDVELKRFLSDELAGIVENELDLEREARFLNLSYTVSRRLPEIVVPRPIPRASSDKLLAMQWVFGAPLRRWEALPTGLRHQIAEKLVHFHSALLLHQSFCRYDNHWSNLKITGDGRLAVLDYGSVLQFGALGNELLSPGAKYQRDHLTSDNLKLAMKQWGEKRLTQILES